MKGGGSVDGAMAAAAAAAAVIKAAFFCWKHAVMMTGCCRPAGLLLLYERIIMLSLSDLHGAHGGRAASTRRGFLRLIMGQDGRISGVRKEEGWWPHEAQSSGGGLPVSGTVGWLEFLHTGSVCVPSVRPTVVVSV